MRKKQEVSVSQRRPKGEKKHSDLIKELDRHMDTPKITFSQLQKAKIWNMKGISELEFQLQAPYEHAMSKCNWDVIKFLMKTRDQWTDLINIKIVVSNWSTKNYQTPI